MYLIWAGRSQFRVRYIKFLKFLNAGTTCIFTATTDITNIYRFQENSRSARMHQANEYSNKSDPVNTNSKILSILTILGTTVRRIYNQQIYTFKFQCYGNFAKISKYICEILQVSKHLHA